MNNQDGKLRFHLKILNFNIIIIVIFINFLAVINVILKIIEIIKAVMLIFIRIIIVDKNGYLNQIPIFYRPNYQKIMKNRKVDSLFNFNYFNINKIS